MAEELLPNRPQSTTRFKNKYEPGSDTARFVNSLDPVVSRAMKRLDAKRANMGQNPLTKAQTRLAGTAANQQRAVTPEPEQGFFGDVASNIADIASAIPHLPLTLYREANAVADLPAAYSALPKTTNPVEQVGNVAQLPGVRFVPGSFVASQFGTDQPGVSGVINNPVISALDVLPYFSKIAKMSTTVKTAEGLAEKARPLQALTGAPTRTPPISTFIKNYRPGGPVTETVQMFNQPVERLAPNPIGKAMDTLKTELTGPRNSVTKTLGKAFAPEVRAMARLNQRAAYDAQTGDLRGYAGIDPEDQVGNDIARKVLEDSQAIDQEFAKQIDPKRRQAILNAGVRDRLDDLTDVEREFLARQDAAQKPLAEHLVATGEVTRMNVGGIDEIYDNTTAADIVKARYNEGKQAAVAKLRDHLNPATEFRASPEDLIADFRTMLADERIAKGQKVQLSRGYLTALDELNLDVSDLRTELTWRGGKSKSMSEWAIPDADDFTGRPVPYNPNVVNESLTELKRLRSSDPIAADLYKSLTTKNFTPETATRAQEALRTLAARKKFQTNLNVDDLRAEINRRRANVNSRWGVERAGGAGGKKTYSDSLAKKAVDRRAQIEAKSVPARYTEAVRQAFDERLLAEKYNLLPDADPTTLAQFDDAVRARAWDDMEKILGEDSMRLFKRYRRETRESWMELRAQGMEPVFMHSVSRQRARSLIDWPSVTDNSKLSLSQTKAKLWDAGPETGDVSIAVQARAMEYLMRNGSKAFANELVNGFAKTSDQVIAEYRPIAIKRIERRGGDVTSELQQELTDLIARDKTPFDPDSFVNGRAGGKAETRAPYYLPRVVGESLDMLTPKPSDLLHALNKPMKLFRTSVLPLSPRWHVYNILGGAVMLLGRADNPVTIMKYARDAYRMTRDGGLHHLMKGVDDLDTIRASRMAPPGEVGNRAQRMATEYALQDYPAEHLYAGGGTLRRLWDSVAVKRTMRDPFNTVVEKSYNANMWFDDFYRSMAYLEGSGGARKMGLSRSAQVAKGIESARNILQNWDTLTPMERSVLRFVFPFYGWTRHLLSYVTKYPADHPWRMSIMANIAEAEMSDANSGLPRTLRGLLFYGDVDMDGKQSAINLDGANPFRDVANWVTLAGFVAGQGGDAGAITTQLNPLLSTPLQLMGVDTRSGTADLFPTLQFDNSTGQLIAAPQDNPLMLGFGNLFPQGRGMTQLLGLSREYNDLMSTNPDAAKRLLRSSFGFPVMRRDIDVPTETMKAELTRSQAQKDKINAAVKSGDYGALTQAYPGLTPFAKRMMILAESQKASKYQAVEGVPGNEGNSVRDILMGSLAKLPV